LLIALNEKGLEFNSRPVDTAQFEQWSPFHRAFAPQGQLPVLVDGGEVMNDAAFTLQYLAEAYPPRLAPTDPVGWYDVQAWNATNDAALLGNVSLLGWTGQTTPEERAAYREKLAAVEGREKPAGWAAVFSDAEASEDQLALARDRTTEQVGKIEAALASTGWLVGGEYSIADIGAFAVVHTLPRLLPEVVNETETPHILAWLARIGERPAVKAALDNGADSYAAPN
jgi:glutathione S-transferase